MEVHRSPMQKILKEQEDATVITNPKEPTKTFMRKLAYIFSIWTDRCKRLIGKH